MIEERFEIYNKNNYNELIKDNDNVIDGDIQIYGIECVNNLLNNQHNTIAQLRGEIADFQELLLENDTICHMRVKRAINIMIDSIWREYPNPSKEEIIERDIRIKDLKRLKRWLND